MITNLFTNGVYKIWEEDRDSQLSYLEVWHEEIRKMNNYDSLVEAKAFFVPNAEYLQHYFGADILNPFYGLYDWDRRCIFDQFVLFPVWNLSGDVVGFGGYDIMSKALQMGGEEIEVETFYRYQSKHVFKRGNYLYVLPQVYWKAVEEKYILLVDGFYDMFSLRNEGFNVAASMGSTITDKILFQLSFIEHVFLLEDNDRAGRMLYDKLKQLRPNVHFIRQNYAGDADDVLKSEFRETYIKTIRESVEYKESSNLNLATLRKK